MCQTSSSLSFSGMGGEGETDEEDEGGVAILQGDGNVRMSGR